MQNYFWMVRIVEFGLGRYIKNFWSSKLLFICLENSINSNDNNKSENKPIKTLTTLIEKIYSDLPYSEPMAK